MKGLVSGLNSTSSKKTLHVGSPALNTTHGAVSALEQKAAKVGLNSDFRWVFRRGSPGTSPTAASAPLVRLQKRSFFVSAPDSEGPF